MPVVEEDGFLRHAEEAGDQGEDSHPVLLSSAHVERLRVERLHETLQAGHVDLVLHNGCKQAKNNTSNTIQVWSLTHFSPVDFSQSRIGL